MLADYTRAFLHHPDGDQQEALRWICSVLSAILHNSLADSDDWNRFDWIDDLVPLSEIVTGEGKLLLEGLTFWFQGQNEWVEPFAASIQLREGNEPPALYEIKFGDADTGLAKIPYGRHRSHIHPKQPDTWMHVFTNR